MKLELQQHIHRIYLGSQIGYHKGMGHIKKDAKMHGFSMVEVLIALVLLAVGLLGLAAMTQLVMRGNDDATHLSNATDVCQLRVEELKDLSYQDLGEADVADMEALDEGATEGDIVQETGLNSQGLTDCDFYDQEFEITGSPCENVVTAGCDDGGPLVVSDFGTSDQACWQHIQSAGPYMYTRSFVVCKGEDYNSGGTHQFGAQNFTSSSSGTYSGEINCQTSAVTRPETLACKTEDILNPGTNSNEKMIKVLCTWRKRDGRCGFVNFSALRVNL
ncbi:MAG: prepilin-type N-terminal cleavage/methylation domain-containing protein [Bdellovibrionales bacterium]|nr:prepilin-type N-terminal cleavage/methylation domain-containing protein [Bdellovibrionales bacterium]